MRGFAPHPFLSHRRRFKSSLLPGKRGPFSFMEKFLFYLFPVIDWVSNSPETHSFTACLGLPAAGRGGFYEGLRPSTPLYTRRVSLLFIPCHRQGQWLPRNSQLRCLFCTPAACREGFFCGASPHTPFDLTGEDPNLRTYLKKEPPFSFLGKFLFYLFPAWLG